jgi:3-hydroxyacyl-[acyl-carrier-protein] dehydratase
MPTPTSPEVLSAIPHRPPFLFVDAIVSETATSIVCSRTFHPEEDFYRGHYPGSPITPGVLLCEAVVQAGAIFLSRKMTASGSGLEGVPLLAKISEVRFRSPVLPGDTVTLVAELKEVVGGFHLMRGSASCGSRRILTLDFAVAWKTPEPAASQQQQQQQ